MSFSNGLNLKIVDNKYIYFPTIVYTIIAVVCYLLFGIEITLLVIIPLALLLVSLISFHTYRSVIKEVYFQDQRNQALLNIHSLIKPRFPLPYLVSWAAFPGLINSIITEVKRIKPDNIVEIGSGSSTIITSYLLEELGKGKITSLDHDIIYGEKTRQELELHSLSSYATVYFRELIKHSINGKNYTWYDTSDLNLEKNSVQVLVVDGPPEKTLSHARYPALPIFYEYLSDEAVVILDDAGRKEESEIVEMWLNEYPEFVHEFIHTQKGISILRRTKS